MRRTSPKLHRETRFKVPDSFRRRVPAFRETQFFVRDRQARFSSRRIYISRVTRVSLNLSTQGEREGDFVSSSSRIDPEQARAEIRSLRSDVMIVKRLD